MSGFTTPKLYLQAYIVRVYIVRLYLHQVYTVGV